MEDQLEMKFQNVIKSPKNSRIILRSDGVVLNRPAAQLEKHEDEGDVGFNEAGPSQNKAEDEVQRKIRAVREKSNAVQQRFNGGELKSAGLVTRSITKTQVEVNLAGVGDAH